MGKRKTCKKLFQTDLRKERSPYMDSVDHHLKSWPESESLTTMKAVENLLPAGFLLQQLDQPRMTRVDSYRAPPLKPTLETIEEDKPPEVVSYLRSKSLPAHRRPSLDCNGHALNRFPSYRPGQGEYLPGACGVTMSGPILPSSYENYDRAPKHRSRFSRVRDALRTVRSGRLRQALNSVLFRMRPTSRRSH